MKYNKKLVYKRKVVQLVSIRNQQLLMVKFNINQPKLIVDFSLIIKLMVEKLAQLV